jgi:hypothetical protein
MVTNEIPADSAFAFQLKAHVHTRQGALILDVSPGAVTTREVDQITRGADVPRDSEERESTAILILLYLSQSDRDITTYILAEELKEVAPRP